MCIHTCACSCHRFSLGIKIKHVFPCCSGKCDKCGQYIRHNQMENHIQQCHPEIKNVDTLEIPYFLRKSSD